MTAEPAEIERAFAAVGPWQSRFDIDGRSYGGELPYQDDGRVAEFFEWVGTPSTVLELGSLRGRTPCSSQPFHRSRASSASKAARRTSYARGPP